MINFPANCMEKYLKQCIDIVLPLVDHRQQLQYRRMHRFELRLIVSTHNPSILTDRCRLCLLFLKMGSISVNWGHII